MACSTQIIRKTWAVIIILKKQTWFVLPNRKCLIWSNRHRLAISGLIIVSKLNFAAHAFGLVLYKKMTVISISHRTMFVAIRTRLFELWRCDVLFTITPLLFIYIHPLHVLDGFRHVAQLIQPNDCVLGDFNLDSYTIDGKREVDTSCEVLYKESVLDEFTAKSIIF